MNTFLKDLAERVLSTAAFAAASVVAMTGFDLFDVDDLAFAGRIAAAAAALSLLKGLAATRFGGDTGSASLVNLASTPEPPDRLSDTPDML